MTLGDDIVIEVGPKSNVAETQSSYVSYQFQSISNKFMSATVWHRATLHWQYWHSQAGATVE